MFTTLVHTAALPAQPAVPRLPRGLIDDPDCPVSAAGVVAGPQPVGDGAASFWQALAAVYAPTSGPLRLGQWECVEDNRLDPRPRTYRATLARGDRIETATARAGGPVAALTAMLHDRGVAVEVLRFHQVVDGDTTATFVRGSDGRRTAWAMGAGADAGDSALRAVIACANRLLAAAT